MTDTDKILHGISQLGAKIDGLDDRMRSVEDRLVVVEGESRRAARTVSKLDKVVNVIALHLLSPDECRALGISQSYTTTSGGHIPGVPAPMAAKGDEG